MNRLIIPVFIAFCSLFTACGCLTPDTQGGEYLTVSGEMTSDEIEAVKAEDEAIRRRETLKEMEAEATLIVEGQRAALLTFEEDMALKRYADAKEIEFQKERVHEAGLDADRRIAIEHQDRDRQRKDTEYEAATKDALHSEEAKTTADLKNLNADMGVSRRRHFDDDFECNQKEHKRALALTLPVEDYGPGSKDFQTTPYLIGEIKTKTDFRAPEEKLEKFQALVTITMIPNPNSNARAETPKVPQYICQTLSKEGKLVTLKNLDKLGLLLALSTFNRVQTEAREERHTQALILHSGHVPAEGLEELTDVTHRAGIRDLKQIGPEFISEDN